MFGFLLLFILNMALIIWIIRWRGMFSCEGLGMAFLALVVGSDGMGLLGAYLFKLLPNPAREFHMRLFPSIVQAIGLISFAAGLYIADPRPRPLKCELHLRRKVFRAAGFFMVGVGLFMKLTALYQAGLLNLSDYFANMYFYQATKRGFEFLDRGVEIAILGMALLMVTYEHKPWRKYASLVSLLAVAFTLTTSKSGLASAFVFLFFTAALFGQLKFWIKPTFVILFSVLTFVGLGIKTQIKYGGGMNVVDFSGSDIIKVATTTIGLRYNNFGLYRGYSFMINRLQERPDMQFNGRVLNHILTGWIPRFLWKDKPGHPFHAIGYLVTEDFSIDPYGNNAPTFAGFAFADYGFWSLIPYLFLGGMTLGLMRKFVSSHKKYPFIFFGYIFFSNSMGNAIAEAGFQSLYYHVFFTMAIILVTSIFVRLSVLQFVRVKKRIPKIPNRT